MSCQRFRPHTLVDHECERTTSACKTVDDPRGPKYCTWTYVCVREGLWEGGLVCVSVEAIVNEEPLDSIQTHHKLVRVAHGIVQPVVSEKRRPLIDLTGRVCHDKFVVLQVQYGHWWSSAAAGVLILCRTVVLVVRVPVVGVLRQRHFPHCRSRGTKPRSLLLHDLDSVVSKKSSQVFHIGDSLVVVVHHHCGRPFFRGLPVLG